MPWLLWQRNRWTLFWRSEPQLKRSLFPQRWAKTVNTASMLTRMLTYFLNAEEVNSFVETTLYELYLFPCHINTMLTLIYQGLLLVGYFYILTFAVLHVKLFSQLASIETKDSFRSAVTHWRLVQPVVSVLAVFFNSNCACLYRGHPAQRISDARYGKW